MKWSRTPWLALVLVVAASAVLGVGALRVDQPATEKSDRPSVKISQRPLVIFIGDSFTSGQKFNSPDVLFPMLVASARGWDLNCICMETAGYVNDSKKSKMVFKDAIADLPSLRLAHRVVLVGGFDDRQSSESALSNGVGEALRVLRSEAPRTPVSLLSPVSGESSASRRLVTEQSRVLKRSAEEFGAQFIDISTVLVDRDGLFAPDGMHPNNSGQRAIAEFINANIPN